MMKVQGFSKGTCFNHWYVSASFVMVVFGATAMFHFEDVYYHMFIMAEFLPS